MNTPKAATGTVWSVNALLIVAIVVGSFKALFFRDRVDPLRDVEAPSAEVVKAAPIQAQNYSTLQNFQNPVEPRKSADPVTQATDIKAELLGTVPSDTPAYVVAYLWIQPRNVFLNAYINEAVEADGVPAPEFSGWKLVRVTRDTAVFSNGTRETELHTKETPIGLGATGGTGPGGTSSLAAGMTRDKVKPVKIASTNDSDQFTLDRQGIAWAVENQESLIRDVTMQDYASGGIQITSIAPGSLASDFGLQQGDVIKSVNGQPVVSSLSLSELRNSEAIKRATALTIGIDRAGMTRALVIRQGPGGPPK